MAATQRDAGFVLSDRVPMRRSMVARRTRSAEVDLDKARECPK
jgi:hypothetical protein